LHSSYHLYTCPLLLLYTYYSLTSSPTPPISILLAPYHTLSLDPHAQYASSFFCFGTFPSSASTQRLAPLSISTTYSKSKLPTANLCLLPQPVFYYSFPHLHPM